MDFNGACNGRNEQQEMTMRQSSRFVSHPIAALLAALSFLGLTPGAAYAHEFVVEVRAVGDARAQILTEALRGFLLATTERDGHANEASNGHLGGLDVYIAPRPTQVAARFPDLKPVPPGGADFIAVIGAAQDVAAEAETIGDDTVVLRPGRLHDANRWAGDEALDAQGFAARYLAAYGQPASEWAARGYNAARRIDDAVRPLGGVDDHAALARAFADSAAGIRW